MNPDGTFNIERVDRPRGARQGDLYHRLLTLSWQQFLVFLIGVYFGTNLFFACLYFALGPGALQIGSSMGLPAGHGERFLDCFFFSVQTFATIGYGTLVPHGILANFIVTIEAFVGLLCIAVLTGIVFARFSRPTAKVIYSEKAVIREINGVPALMVRFANLRTNQVAEAQVTMTYARNETTAEGEFYREFETLQLEQNRSSMFVLSWTVAHHIDRASPLFGLTAQDLVEKEAEIFVVMTGWDETFAQTIHARKSYGPDEILWGYRFKDIIHRTSDERRLVLDIRKINETEPLEPNT